jgi:hypothetical protein
MKRPLIALVACSTLLVSASAADALPARMIKALKEMNPGTRFEQRCNIEAMDRIAKESRHFRPDELVTYAFGNPKVKGDVMVAKGAAFRSHNVWRHLTFRCKTDSDHMNVLSFKYKIGAVVPRDKWSKHYLVPQ